MPGISLGRVICGCNSPCLNEIQADGFQHDNVPSRAVTMHGSPDLLWPAALHCRIKPQRETGTVTQHHNADLAMSLPGRWLLLSSNAAHPSQRPAAVRELMRCRSCR